MDQLSRVLTHVKVNMVIYFILDLWQERKSKFYCYDTKINVHEDKGSEELFKHKRCKQQICTN